MLKTQISQVLQQQASLYFFPGYFSGQPEPNLKEKMNDVTTRSGKQVEGPSEKGKEVKETEPIPLENEVVEKEQKEAP